MRRLVSLLVLLVLAQPAEAASEFAVKDDGVAVEAHADDQGRGVVHASIDIAAPPAVVFRIILDCDRAARMSPGVKHCRVVSRAPDGTEIREHAVKWTFFMPTLRSTSRVTLEPDRRVGFTCIGGDIRIKKPARACLSRRPFLPPLAFDVSIFFLRIRGPCVRETLVKTCCLR